MTTSPPPASIALANGVVVKERELIDAAALWYFESTQRQTRWEDLDGFERQSWLNAVRPGVQAMLALNRVDAAIARAKEQAALASPPAARQRSGVAISRGLLAMAMQFVADPSLVRLHSIHGRMSRQQCAEALAALDQEARDAE